MQALKHLNLDEANRKYLVIAALIVTALSSLAIRIACFRGYVGLDDSEYVKLAVQFVRGNFHVGAYSGPPVFPLRMGVILPAALILKFFTLSQWTAGLYPLVLSICFVFLIFWGTHIFFGPRAGILAAIIWALLPLDIENATTLLPDLPCAFFASLGVVVALYKIKNYDAKHYANLLWGLVSGLCFGLAWLCKGTVLYYIPFALILMVVAIRKQGKPAIYFWAGVAMASAAIYLTEAAIYYKITGDIFFRLHETERNYQILKNGFFTEGSHWGWPVGGSYTKTLLKRIFLVGPKTILLNSSFLYINLFAFIAFLYNRYWRESNDTLLVLWFFVLVLMFNFGSSSLSSYRPLPLFERYMYPIQVPAFMIVGGWLDQMIGGRLSQKDKGLIKEKMFWGSIMCMAILMLGAYKTLREYRGEAARIAWRSGVTEVYRLISPDNHIFTDPISEMGLNFFWSYPEKESYSNLEDLKDSSQVEQNSYVLINKRYIKWLNENAGMWLSDISGYHLASFLNNPPSQWDIVWRNDHAVLYKVTSGGKG